MISQLKNHHYKFQLDFQLGIFLQLQKSAVLLPHIARIS